MHTFKYIGLSQNGIKESGVLLGANTAECLTILSNRGIHAISINRVYWLSKKFSNQELISFFRHILFQLQCEVPILTAISTYISISNNITVQSVLGHILYELENGKSLYEAFSIETSIFGYIIPSMMHSAEISGKLSESIESIIIYLEFQENIRKKIKKAAIYPIFVLLVATASFLFCITYIGPQISELISVDNNVPFITSLCIKMIPDNPYIFLAILACIVLLLFLIPKSFLLRIGEKIPYVSTLIQRIYEWHCSTILFISLRSKLDLTKGLQLMEHLVKNTPYYCQFKALFSDILCGEKLSSAIRHLMFFTPTTIHSIKIAEESNKLESIMHIIANNQKEEINFLIKKLGIKVSVSITLCTGLLLVIVLLGLFHPLYNSVNIFET